MTGLEIPDVKGGRWTPRHGRKRSKGWRIFAIVLAAILTTVVVFHEQALIWLGQSLVVSQPLEPADLIYVLAGDFWGSRVLRGADLGVQGWAHRVLFSGGLYTGGGYVNRYTGDLSVEFAVQHGYPRSLFYAVPMEGHSTLEEARLMKPVFHRLGAKRIILVTSNFHSRRAEQVFRLYLPEFEFEMESVPDSNFNPQTWWKNQWQRRLLASEYQKLVGTFLVKFHLATDDWLRQVQQ